MNRHATVNPGSASRRGGLWGARPDDWVLGQDQQLPTYEAVSERIGDARTALLAVAGLATLAGPAREHELKNVIVDGLAPYGRPDRLENEYHYLIARA
jgi:hypothetical protein